jgi:N-acetylglucosaminyldiphosphoundecaprenol N-acetyl-beta-D-mannosaminyltransferase
MNRIDLDGIPIDAVDLDTAVARVAGLVSRDRSAHVVTANVDFVAQAQRDAEVRAAIADADLVVADGVPLLWMARALGTPLPGRVNGTDLVERLLARAGAEGWRVCVVGGAPGVVELARDAVRSRYGVELVGAWSPSAEEMDDVERGARVARSIAALECDLVLLAIGGGRQERWIRTHRERLGGGVIIGVGSAVDFLAGSRRRAPRWAQRHGFEWLFRLVQEPRRLARRYLVDDLGVLARFAVRRIGRRGRA